LGMRALCFARPDGPGWGRVQRVSGAAALGHAAAARAATQPPRPAAAGRGPLRGRRAALSSARSVSCGGVRSVAALAWGCE